MTTTTLNPSKPRRALRSLPLALAVGLAAGAAHADFIDTTINPDPVTYGSSFTVTTRIDAVMPNEHYVSGIYRFIEGGSADELLDTVEGMTGNGIDLTVTSGSIVADSALFTGGMSPMFYSNTIVRESDAYVSGLFTVNLRHVSRTTTKDANRILPHYRATITADSPTDAIPTGTVDFYVGDHKICSDTLNSAGEAHCSSLASVIGLHKKYTARYSGDGVFAASEAQGEFCP